MTTVGELRRSAVLMTYGPGSLADFREGGATVSVVMGGLEEWDSGFPSPGLSNSQVIHEERLEKVLGVGGFRLPPVREPKPKDDKRALVAARFPDWLQCPKCNQVGPWSKWAGDPGKMARHCARCNEGKPADQRTHTVPVRFVMACPHGHMDEFPWHFWVGHKPECENRQKRGKLNLEAKSAGLAGLILSCQKCGESRSMEGVFQARSWTGFPCSGRRPWLPGASEQCEQATRALQRGASNLYFPVMDSALSIPPWANGLQTTLGDLWHALISIDDVESRTSEIERLRKDAVFIQRFDHIGWKSEALSLHIERLKDQLNGVDRESIRRDEFSQFVSTQPGSEVFPDYESRRCSVPTGLASYLSDLVRVVRLREVRVLRGFTRISAAAAENAVHIAPLSLKRLSWLPAIEIRGEGIFFSLDATRLSEWEQRPSVAARAGAVARAWLAECALRGVDPDSQKPVTARFLLAHSLAHVVMRELTLECGYSSASLRERLFVDDSSPGHAGVLIYTGASDADGTLGGLERQGRPARFESTFLAAIRASQWCSSDPLCIHGNAEVDGTLSNAACHACLMAAETSCEEFNRFLDRAMLVGTPEDPTVGFFSDLGTE